MEDTVVLRVLVEDLDELEELEAFVKARRRRVKPIVMVFVCFDVCVCFEYLLAGANILRAC